jgi:V8-like Glu-specific endopeptidase
VGALFFGGSHYCTASVVHSPSGNLVLTAAHCVHDGAGGDYLTGLQFEPGYHDGIAPYGTWNISHVTVAPQWAATSDPDLDVAFVTVHQPGNPNPIESITGANTIGIDRGFGNPVELTAYPDDAERPTTCRGITSRADTYQIQLTCPGFPDGTSGSPWVTAVDPATALGTVIGVIGGYQRGGDEPDLSYSSYFDDDVENLYRTSTTG